MLKVFIVIFLVCIGLVALSSFVSAETTDSYFSFEPQNLYLDVGEETVIEVYVNADVNEGEMIGGYSFGLQIPEPLEIVSYNLLTDDLMNIDNVTGIVFSFSNELQEGIISYIIFNMGSGIIEDAKLKIMEIRVRGEGSGISNISFVDTLGKPPVQTIFSIGPSSFSPSFIYEGLYRVGDSDGDGLNDIEDNCPDTPNPGQEDTDSDGIGDACDPETCGNGLVEGEEECDDSDLSGGSCQSLGYDDGTLSCSDSCTYDTSQCFNFECGNNIIEGGEVCDGTELDGRTCDDFDYTYGDLSCLPDCTDFDTSGCTNAICGNGVIDAEEQCDDGNTADGDGCSSICTIECVPPGCCEIDADCDDGNLCTQDSCFGGECIFEEIVCNDDNVCTDDYCNSDTGDCIFEPNNNPCDDGLWCTVSDVCIVGTCLGNSRDCGESGDQCIIGICDEDSDQCVGEQKPDGDPCVDENLCTFDDYCLGGKCISGVEKDCSDNNTCTDDLCDSETGECEYLNNTNPCDDGLYCTINDICSMGMCVGEIMDPSDNVSCTIDLCDEEADICTHIPDDDACDDGLFCNGVETCNAESGCLNGTPPDTDDGVACTVDSCNELVDLIVHEPDNEACEDDNVCTNDYCDAAEGCVNEPVTGGEISCGLGVCNHTVIECFNGTLQVCDPFEGAGNETCDSLDNDCDGEVDEGFDSDNDTVADCFDNCPGVYNPDQGDDDEDGIGNKCENHPPVIETANNITVNEGEPAMIVLNVWDPDSGDRISASLNDTRFIAFRTFNYSWTPGFNDSGIYDVEVFVTDGKDYSYFIVRVIVLNVNRPPEIDSVQNVTVVEGEIVIINVTASDPDGDYLSYAINDMRFTQDRNLFMWLTETGDGGFYTFTIAVTDGGFTVYSNVGVHVIENGSRFNRGDTNGDYRIDIADPVFIINYIYADGREPTCLDTADVNDDSLIDRGDAIYLLNYLFLGGLEPPAPFDYFATEDDWGTDPTDDNLTCVLY